MPDPFELFGVVHLLRPAGRTAHDLEELRAGIAAAGASSLFHHTFRNQLGHAAADELPPDDWSAWVNGVVQDRETAERLSFAIQEQGHSPAALRSALLEVLESVPERTRLSRDAPEEGDFVFLEMDSVKVPTGLRPSDGLELMESFAALDPSILFYHLVEQPWLEPERPGLVEWLRATGGARVADVLRKGIPAGLTVEATRREILRRWRRSRLGRRLAEAAGIPEHQRREAGRRAVAGLVRRITQPEDADDARPGS